MLLWGGSFVAMKVAVQHLDPWLIVLGRLFLAALAFGPFLLRLPPWPLIRNHLPGLLLMALAEPCFYFVFEAKALTLTQAGQAGVITALLPVMVACAAGFVLGERTSARGFAGLALGVAGAVLLSVFAPEDAYSPDPMLGNLLEMTAMACATVYTLMVKRLAPSFSPMFLTAFQAFTGTLFFLPVLFISPFPAAFSWQGLTAVAYMGLFVSVGAYACYNFALSRLPASRAAASVNLIPAFTLILGWLLLGETIQGWQWLGIALIFAGTRLTGHIP